MHERILGLSLTQPWATLMAVGAKRIETRSWRTPYRGWIAIQAAKGFPRWAQELCEEGSFEFHLSDNDLEAGDLPRGQIVAVGRLIDCVRTDDITTPSDMAGLLQRCGREGSRLEVGDERDFGDYSPGRWAWLLREVWAIDPPRSGIPVRGSMGLWSVPSEVRTQIDLSPMQGYGSSDDLLPTFADPLLAVVS